MDNLTADQTPDPDPGLIECLLGATARYPDFCDPDIWAGDLSPAGERNRRVINALRAAMAGAVADGA